MCSKISFFFSTTIVSGTSVLVGFAPAMDTLHHATFKTQMNPLVSFVDAFIIHVDLTVIDAARGLFRYEISYLIFFFVLELTAC